MTIYEIKQRTAKSSPHFFSRDTLKFFGQRMKDFRVTKHDAGKYLISAPSYWDGKLMGYTQRLFNPNTNELEEIKQ